jgi:hypothetical protein
MLGQMLKFPAITLVAFIGHAFATPAGAETMESDSAKPVECEQIADAIERSQCIVQRNIKGGGGVKAIQPQERPGVLAAPPG